MWFTVLTSIVFVCFGVYIGKNMIDVISLTYKKSTTYNTNEAKVFLKAKIRKKTIASILAFILLIFIMVLVFFLKGTLLCSLN